MLRTLSPEPASPGAEPNLDPSGVPPLEPTVTGVDPAVSGCHPEELRSGSWNRSGLQPEPANTALDVQSQALAEAKTILAGTDQILQNAEKRAEAHRELTRMFEKFEIRDNRQGRIINEALPAFLEKETEGPISASQERFMTDQLLRLCDFHKVDPFALREQLKSIVDTKRELAIGTEIPDKLLKSKPEELPTQLLQVAREYGLDSDPALTKARIQQVGELLIDKQADQIRAVDPSTLSSAERQDFELRSRSFLTALTMFGHDDLSTLSPHRHEAAEKSANFLEEKRTLAGVAVKSVLLESDRQMAANIKDIKKIFDDFELSTADRALVIEDCAGAYIDKVTEGPISYEDESAIRIDLKSLRNGFPGTDAEAMKKVVSTILEQKREEAVATLIPNQLFSENPADIKKALIEMCDEHGIGGGFDTPEKEQQRTQAGENYLDHVANEIKRLKLEDYTQEDFNALSSCTEENRPAKEQEIMEKMAVDLERHSRSFVKNLPALGHKDVSALSNTRQEAWAIASDLFRAETDRNSLEAQTKITELAKGDGVGSSRAESAKRERAAIEAGKNALNEEEIKKAFLAGLKERYSQPDIDFQACRDELNYFCSAGSMLRLNSFWPEVIALRNILNP